MSPYYPSTSTTWQKYIEYGSALSPDAREPDPDQRPHRDDQNHPLDHRGPPDRVAQRSPGRSTEDTDQEGVAPIRIADFAKSTGWLVDKDPKRIKSAKELPSDYKWNRKQL